MGFRCPQPTIATLLDQQIPSYILKFTLLLKDKCNSHLSSKNLLFAADRDQLQKTTTGRNVKISRLWGAQPQWEHLLCFEYKPSHLDELAVSASLTSESTSSSWLCISSTWDIGTCHCACFGSSGDLNSCSHDCASSILPIELI